VTSELEQIAAQSIDLDRLAAALAAGAHQQQKEMQQIQATMSRIQEFARQSAASSQESAAVAEQLSAQSAALADISRDLEREFVGDHANATTPA
jgi:methyl-accepting chemotaxis protein